MATFILQRTFSEPQEGEKKKKGGLGKKLAIAGGTLAATAGALYGVKTGKIGSAGMQKSLNTTMANIGGKMGNLGKAGGKLNQTATKLGDKLIESGAKGAGHATSRAMNTAMKTKEGLKFTAQDITAGAQKSIDRTKNKALTLRR